jgi:diaminopimelate decarboxylase
LRSGELRIEGVRAIDLLQKHGSPLYVVSEDTLRMNFRRVREAFSDVQLAFAETVAARAFLVQNRAYGEVIVRLDRIEDFDGRRPCATFMGGADPDKIVVNGSSKTYEEVERAARLGVRINIDAEDEIGFVERAATKLGCTVRVNLRLKVVPNELSALGSDYLSIGKDEAMIAALRGEKWGASVELASAMIERLRKIPGVVPKMCAR